MNESFFASSDGRSGQWSRICRPSNPGLSEKNDLRIFERNHACAEIRLCRKDNSSEYGPHKTIYIPFARWSEAGIWEKLLAAVAGDPDAPEQVAIDSSQVKIHRCASGGKGGPRRKR